MKSYGGVFVGFIMGAVTAWFLTRNYYSREYEIVDQDLVDEVEEIKEDLKRVGESRPVEVEQPKIDRKGPRVNVVDNVKDLSVVVLDDGDDACDDYMEIPKEDRDDIELIDEDSYDEEYPHFDKIEYEYKVEDDVLYDPSAKAEVSMSTIGGRGMIDDFMNRKGAFMYIRDHKNDCDYLIEKCSIHDNIPEYHSIASMYDEEKSKIIEAKYEGIGGNKDGKSKN